MREKDVLILTSDASFNRTWLANMDKIKFTLI